MKHFGCAGKYIILKDRLPNYVVPDLTGFTVGFHLPVDLLCAGEWCCHQVMPFIPFSLTAEALHRP